MLASWPEEIEAWDKWIIGLTSVFNVDIDKIKIKMIKIKMSLIKIKMSKR